MKKFFSFLIAALFSASMWADDTWTVAGSSTAILGTSWDAQNTANDMSNDGTYWYLAKSDFTIEEEQVLKFKVCKDHGWTTAYPSSDYEISIPAGITKLHFMFNSNGNSVACAYSFSVVGSSETLFGASWGNPLPINDMNESAGIFTWTKTDVILAEGTIMFKVAANHAWGHAWPGDNYELEIPSSGKYDVTITFDPAKQQVTAVATKTGEAVVVPTIKMYGDFTGSGEWADTEDFVKTQDNDSASLTLTNLAVGTYEFGVKKDGTWVANGKAFTRSNASQEVVAGSGNLSITIDKTGNYEFIWVYETNTLSVVYPTLANSAVTIAAPVHGSITVTKGENPVASGDNVEEFSTLTVTLSPNTESYIFSNLRYYKTGDESTVFPITAGQLTMPDYAITITADEAARRLANGFYLKKTTVALDDITADLKFSDADGEGERTLTTSLTEGDKFKVVEITDDAIVGWYPDGTNNDYTVDADHAGASKTIYFRQADYDGDGWHYKHIYVPANPVDPTAIDNTEAGAKAVKRLVNGQLVIEKNGKTFNALGAEVK